MSETKKYLRKTENRFWKVAENMKKSTESQKNIKISMESRKRTSYTHSPLYVATFFVFVMIQQSKKRLKKI